MLHFHKFQERTFNLLWTFSPAAELLQVWLIAAIGVQNDWEIKQMDVDVDSAYLHAPLKETIFMW